MASGSRNWLVVRTKRSCELVIVIRRSSSCLGRIEIRSSSEASQLIVLSAKSLLPLKPRNPFSAQRALPTTTKRPCEFSLPVLYVPTAAIVRGPFLFLGSSGFTDGELRFVVARLVPEDSSSFSTEVLSPFLISIERVTGNPVAV